MMNLFNGNIMLFEYDNYDVRKVKEVFKKDEEITYNKLKELLGGNVSFIANNKFIVCYNADLQNAPLDDDTYELQNITATAYLNRYVRFVYNVNDYKLSINEFDYKYFKGNVIIQLVNQRKYNHKLYDFCFTNEEIKRRKLIEFGCEELLYMDKNIKNDFILYPNGIIKRIYPKNNVSYTSEELYNYIMDKASIAPLCFDRDDVYVVYSNHITSELYKNTVNSNLYTLFFLLNYISVDKINISPEGVYIISSNECFKIMNKTQLS